MSISITNYYDILDDNYGLILTANSVEKEAVKKLLGDDIKADIGITHQGSALSFADPHILLHVTGTAGGSSEKSVGYIARHFLGGKRPRPAFLILVGFCWGNPRRVSVGDVIVATTVASLNHQRESPEGRMYERADKISPVVLDQQVIDEIAAGKPFRIHNGTIASAELYLAAEGPRDALIDQHPDLLGGEMEAFGFLADLRDVPWIIVKGVSDDAGAEIDKKNQLFAAERAASLTSELVKWLTASTAFPTPAMTSPRSALIDAIIGDSIAISRVDDLARLNDHLNDEIGPKLEQRLLRYISDDSAQAGLHRALMKLILEIIQNAMRHGNAGRAVLTFYETRIEVIDDGEHFDLGSLSGDRGGAMAWEDFSTRFLHTGMATVTSTQGQGKRGNHYGFKVNLLTEALRKARAKCSATIQHGAIGAPGGSQPVLRYDPDCQTIHVSVHDVRMFSRSRILVQAIIAEIEAGKTVYVACPDTDEMRVHEHMLRDYLGPQLRIYVADRAGI